MLASTPFTCTSLVKMMLGGNKIHGLTYTLYGTLCGQMDIVVSMHAPSVDREKIYTYEHNWCLFETEVNLTKCEL